MNFNYNSVRCLITVFKNIVLMRIYLYLMRKIHREELHNLYSGLIRPEIKEVEKGEGVSKELKSHGFAVSRVNPCKEENFEQERME